jgi:hypothetical protein
LPGSADDQAFWLQTANQNACEIARLAGFDMVVFDAEHGDEQPPRRSALSRYWFSNEEDASALLLQAMAGDGDHDTVC